MLSAFLIALREGVEAALVVGIILVYLSRTSRRHLTRYVWGGVAAAVALSLAVAIALERFSISEDGFEGLLLLVAAVFVVTMVVWMNHIARHLKKEIEDKAHEMEAEVSIERNRADRFDLGEVFLEIGLVITSITLLSGRRLFWLLGIVLGIVGIGLAATGFFIH